MYVYAKKESKRAVERKEKEEEAKQANGDESEREREKNPSANIRNAESDGK
jgi:hypothetical protein